MNQVSFYRIFDLLNKPVAFVVPIINDLNWYTFTDLPLFSHICSVTFKLFISYVIYFKFVKIMCLKIVALTYLYKTAIISETFD